eukprot:6815421-Prymnesium_polylepis.1
MAPTRWRACTACCSTVRSSASDAPDPHAWGRARDSCRHCGGVSPHDAATTNPRVRAAAPAGLPATAPMLLHDEMAASARADV